MENRISICIIAKNEERFIGECIESVLPIAYEVIILDTGSTDKTKEIAASYGEKIKLFDYIWEDDFSKARNKCISYATGNWIVRLDADERFTKTTKENLITFLNNNDFTNRPVVFHFKIVEYDSSGTFAGGFFTNIMFRNGFGIHFVRPIHEYLYCEKYKLEHVNCPFLAILHVGESDRSQEELIEKKKGYINKLTALINSDINNPENYHYYRHLGDEYYEIRDYNKALEAYENSYALINESVQNKKNSVNQSILSRIEKVLLFHVKDFVKAKIFIQKHLILSPDSPEVLFHLGYCKNRLGQIEEGLNIHKKLLESLKEDNFNQPLISNICIEIGRFGKDINYLERAEQIFPKSIAIKRHILKYYYLKNNQDKIFEYYKLLNENEIGTDTKNIEQKVIEELLKENSWEQWENNELNIKAKN